MTYFERLRAHPVGNIAWTPPRTLLEVTEKGSGPQTGSAISLVVVNGGANFESSRFRKFCVLFSEDFAQKTVNVLFCPVRFTAFAPYIEP
jgi:hypothetical protein